MLQILTKNSVSRSAWDNKYTASDNCESNQVRFNSVRLYSRVRKNLGPLLTGFCVSFLTGIQRTLLLMAKPLFEPLCLDRSGKAL